jgi:hypothetical protein
MQNVEEYIILEFREKEIMTEVEEKTQHPPVQTEIYIYTVTPTSSRTTKRKGERYNNRRPALPAVAAVAAAAAVDRLLHLLARCGGDGGRIILRQEIRQK